MKKTIFLAVMAAFLVSCGGGKFNHDASGVFESVEVVVSAEVPGRVEWLRVEEGDLLSPAVDYGLIDTVQLGLKLQQFSSAVRASGYRSADITKQIAATRDQIANAEVDLNRTRELVAAGAAGQKQLDDITTQLAVLRSQLTAQLSTLERGNLSISEDTQSQIAQVAQIRDQIAKSRISSPIRGRVLTKFTEPGEYVAPGKPLFSVANVDTLRLRAYITASQLTQVRLDQSVTVFADQGKDESRQYKGRIIWIADKAEFTPKTIQTRDERANLVYAIKIAVPNTDSLLKIGMYGDVDF